MDYLKLACAVLEIEPDEVMSHKVYDDHIALVVNNGIKGCPKHLIPLVDLKPKDLPEPVKKPEQPAEKAEAKEQAEEKEPKKPARRARRSK